MSSPVDRPSTFNDLETVAEQTSKNQPTDRLSDIVILVMGMAKAGKSYFISKLLKEVGSDEKVQIGYGLSPCTRELQAVAVNDLSSKYPALKGRRVLIVDTPGFCGEEFARDYSIFSGIVNWLDHSRQKGDALGGVIYVHDISQDDFSRAARANLDLFSRMCGEAFSKKVVFVTTKWCRGEGRDFEATENRLLVKFWRSMIERGAQTMRLSDEDEGGSALRIVDNLLGLAASPDSGALLYELLQIQDELIGPKRVSLAETDAGKAMHQQLHEAIATRRKVLQVEPGSLAEEATSKRGRTQKKSSRMLAVRMFTGL